jgi:hypothetical protein
MSAVVRKLRQLAPVCTGLAHLGGMKLEYFKGVEFHDGVASAGMKVVLVRQRSRRIYATFNSVG